MREPARIAEFENKIAWNLAFEARVEHVGIRRLQIRRNAEEIANDGRDRRRRIRKRLDWIRRQLGRNAGEARTRAEAIRIGKIGRSSESDRTVLIVLRDQIAAEP